MAVNLLENFHASSAKNRVFFFKIQNLNSKNYFTYSPSRLERCASELPFLYSLYGVIFLICCQMATDLFENFHKFLAENQFFFKFKISSIEIILAGPLPRLKRGYSGLSFSCNLREVVFLMCSHGTDLLENFYTFLAKNKFFSKFKISTLKIISAVAHYHNWKEDPLDYHLHIISRVYYFLYVPKWPLIF